MKEEESSSVNSSKNKSYVFILRGTLKLVDEMGIGNCYNLQSTYFSSLYENVFICYIQCFPIVSFIKVCHILTVNINC